MNATRARPLRNVLLAALVVLTNGSLVVPARAAAAALAGTTWQLVRFQDSNGQVLTADDRSSYTVEFRTDDTVAVRVDCHRGRGTWVSRSASQLELGPVVLTRAACPQTPLHAQIAKQWTSIRSYELRDAHLFLSLGPNGGAFEFEPAAAAATAPTSTASTAAVPAAAVPAAATAPVATTPAPTAPAATAPTAVAPAPASKAPLSWLDDPKPVSWTTAGAAIPRAPHPTGTFEPRCRALTRPPESQADKQLTEQGWDLIGAYQGGWGVRVLEGAASYDGMCRPLAYQEFVFVRGVFAGTLSPGTMDSRADGSLNRVTLQGDRRLVAEYARYTRADALCCPSRTTSVVFEIAPDQVLVRPLSTSTVSNR
ncbi:MAG TPA: LppP/LprE family lipoprotein [Steroidobacteraceae bacterium]|nr:LppP/LprE family lipoprotein [Steroidobacteraceae bacterium]